MVFIRVTGMFVSAPVLNTNRIPMPVKVGLAFLMSIVLFPLVGGAVNTLPSDLFPYVILVLKELLVGLSIGFVATMIFSAVHMAGEISDMQSGFAFAALIDPTSGERTSIIGQFQINMAWLIFLGVNGHHVMINGVADSFRMVPLGNAALDGRVISSVLVMCSQVFIIGLQIGAPVVGAVLLGDIALGVLARTVPQLNILVLGFPIKMMLGLIVLMLSLPLVVTLERNLVPVMQHAISTLLHMAGH